MSRLVDLVSLAWGSSVDWLATVTLVWLAYRSNLSRSVWVVPVDWDLDGSGDSEDSEQWSE